MNLRAKLSSVSSFQGEKEQLLTMLGHFVIHTKFLQFYLAPKLSRHYKEIIDDLPPERTCENILFSTILAK